MKWKRCFFVKSGPFLNAGYIMYSTSIFYFTFYLFFGGGNAPPSAYGPAVTLLNRTWLSRQLASSRFTPSFLLSLVHSASIMSLQPRLGRVTY